MAGKASAIDRISTDMLAGTGPDEAQVASPDVIPLAARLPAVASDPFADPITEEEVQLFAQAMMASIT